MSPPHYAPQVPARLLDTRPDGQTIDGQFVGGAQPANIPISLLVSGRAGVPSYATAAVLNVTIVAPTQNSFATVWPSGEAMPNASNLNFEVGRNVANLVFAEIGGDGRVNINFAAGDAFVIADIVGWFGDAFDYEPVLPARLLDTRTPGATIDGLFSGSGPLAGGTWLDLTVLGRGGIPSDGVDSVVVNVTATQPTHGSYVTVWPTDGHGPPNASTLNMVPDRTVPNLAIVKVGSGGRISLFNEQGLTHLIVDVVGWFPATFEISSRALTPAVQGTAFSQTLQTIGATGPVDWGFLDEAPGLGGNAGNGTISGTPNLPGTYSTFAVAASGSALAARVLPHIVFSTADGFTPVAQATLFSSFAGTNGIPAGSIRNYTAGGVAGVPSDAKAVVLNVTAKSPTNHFLQMWATGQAQPNFSSLLVTAGEEATNVVVVPLGTGGQFTVYNFLAADYRLDVLGYFGSSSAYQATPATRVLDTRSPSNIVLPGQTLTVVAGAPVPSARAVVLHVIATEAAGFGSLDVVPSGAAFPSPTTLDFGPGVTLQTVVVPLDIPGGSVDVRNRAGGSATHVIVDVFGYFT